MSEYDEGTYEMLWNCAYCGTEKLLGLTHRHCPVCGAQQDAEARYFPSEEEKVAVEDHEYHGADKTCGSCKNPQSAKSAFCANCGAPMEGAGEVKRVEDKAALPGNQPAAPAPAPKPLPPKKKKSKAIPIIIVLVLLIIAVIAVAVLWTKEVGVTVTGHTWSRRIGVEVFSEVNESNWCDMMPSDARRVTRTKEVRSYKKIPNGEDCSTQRVDKGDGTYSQRKVCTPRYREEPIYDQKCRYWVNRWVEKRAELAQGTSLAQPPVWPPVKLGRTGRGLGAEREGRRTEIYELHLLDSENENDKCSYPQATWAAIPVGTKYDAEKGVLTGSIDCATLKAPQ